jgi:hypothetical protein
MMRLEILNSGVKLVDAIQNDIFIFNHHSVLTKICMDQLQKLI